MVARAAPSQRRLRRTVAPLVVQAARTPGADRYRKRFSALAHLWVLLLHVLLGSASLRQTHALLTTTPRWWQRWGMDGWISFSQLARSSTSRPSACVEQLLEATVARAHRQPVAHPLWRKLRAVEVLDSTFVRLSAKLSPWAVHGAAVPGVRLQCALALASQIPSYLRLTLADINDHTALEQRPLTDRCGWTLLLDRGYYGHRLLARLQTAGVHFLTRLQPQAHVQITAHHRVPLGATPDGDTILAEATITLGSPHNRRGAVLPGLRLVSSQNRAGQIQHFVTDRHDLAATEIVMLYRKRWQIELFFRWLKQHLGASRSLGRSRAAVWLTLLLVIIVALIVLLAEVDRPAALSRVSWARHLAMALLTPIRDD